MSKEAKKKSLSFRVATHEERAKREADIAKRSERNLALQAQGLNHSTIGIRLGLMCTTVGRIVREHGRAVQDQGSIGPHREATKSDS